MSQYKDFQGKTLDDAIKEACDYFGVEREKLEIEIINDAKSGIFGLVGAKKASIRACRVKIEEAVSSFLEPVQASSGEERREDVLPGKTRQIEGKPSGRSAKAKGKGPVKSMGTSEAGAEKAAGRPVGEGRATRERRPAQGRVAKKGSERGAAVESKSGKQLRERGPASIQDVSEAAMPSFGPSAVESAFIEGQLEPGREDLPEFDLAGCDTDLLVNAVEETVLRLVEPIVGKVPCKVETGNGRVRVGLDCGDAMGLLVGREGQTLASVQYLASRIIARKIGGTLRLQIDVGNYRERQDDRLKELAVHLAAKVKQTRRPQSTRPLSAYQRRIVHLALEGDTAVSTRSKGEGAQRRVVIYLNTGGEERSARR